MELTMIRAGRIVNTHGVRGEVKVLPEGVEPELLLDCPALYVDGAPMAPAARRVHKGCLLVKLKGIDDMDAALTLNRDRPGGVRPWLLTLPLLCGITLLLGWLYHVTLGGEALWVDLALYAAVMVLGFWLPTRFSGPFRGVRWLLPILAAALLALLIAWFTVRPPEALLFRDLSAVGSWLPLPC